MAIDGLRRRGVKQHFRGHILSKGLHDAGELLGQPLYTDADHFLLSGPITNEIRSKSFQ